LAEAVEKNSPLEMDAIKQMDFKKSVRAKEILPGWRSTNRQRATDVDLIVTDSRPHRIPACYNRERRRTRRPLRGRPVWLFPAVTPNPNRKTAPNSLVVL
jgi:hypothetical protein